ncbi:hypothetical protein [Streptomyces sp. NPDC048425]|uniref:hypothetical protein n=1 Tax=Streptomyces sp. NPDC048425 TaxID=3365548 RepID=UPI00371D2BD9
MRRTNQICGRVRKTKNPSEFLEFRCYLRPPSVRIAIVCDDCCSPVPTSPDRALFLAIAASELTL